jgi:hypothetical protein
MDHADRDPIQLERQAVTVAALAAGLTQEQAMATIDACAPLLRRASTLRNIALIRESYANVPDDDCGKIEVERVITDLLIAVDGAQTSASDFGD